MEMEITLEEKDSKVNKSGNTQYRRFGGTAGDLTISLKVSSSIDKLEKFPKEIGAPILLTIECPE